MYKTLYLTLFIFSTSLTLSFAEEVIWQGKVSADGTPSPVIHLDLNKKYQIFVSGSINLGKWVQAGKELAEDPTYEYNTPTGPTHLSSFKTSNALKLDDKNYHDTHSYSSPVFVAKQNRIHFWIDDHDYDDNSGAFDVKVVKLD